MKIKKVLGFVSLGLIVVGLVLVFMSFAMSGFDFNNIFASSEELTNREHVFDAIEVKQLEVDLASGEINVSYYDGDKVKVVYNTNENYKFSFTEKDGYLMASSTMSFKRIFFNYREIMPSISIFVPKDTVIDFDLFGANMNLELTNMKFESFSASGINAIILVNNIEAESISISNKNGKIECSNSKANAATFKGTNSNIGFDLLTVNNLNADSDNGRVVGVINGNESDYSITSRTVNGHNNLNNRETASDKSINITTINGRIDVTFAK